MYLWMRLHNALEQYAYRLPLLPVPQSFQTTINKQNVERINSNMPADMITPLAITITMIIRYRQH